MADYVETLPATDIDETGFMAHGAAHGYWVNKCPAFDWSTQVTDLPGITDEVETYAHHVIAIWIDPEYSDPRRFKKWIDIEKGVFYYRALCYTDGV